MTSRTIGSLFSGGGGWEAGAVIAGFKPTFAVELDPGIASHYRKVFGDHVTVGSAMGQPYARFPRVSVLVSSPPCQPTTKSGIQARNLREARGIVRDDEAEGSFCDPRVGLATLEAAEALRPASVIVENSDGYLGSAVYRQIFSGLERLGYHCDGRVLDASHYGVVSGRKRTVLRATLGPLPPWPAATPTISWADAILDLIPQLPRADLAPWQAKGLRDRPPPVGVPVLIAGGNVTRNDKGYLVWRSPSQPAWTTQKANNTSGMRVIDQHGVVRQMTTRAIARLQGFPDWYALPAQRSAAINILGNSMPPVFARVLLESVA